MATQDKGSKSLWERIVGAFKDNDGNYRNPNSITGILGSIGATMSNFKSSKKNKERYFGIVFSAVSAIADSFSATEIHLYRRKADGEVEIVDNHKALDFLRKPNTFMANNDLMINWASNINISGNVFWTFINDDGTDVMIPLEPSRMKPKTNKQGTQIVAYEYQSGAGEMIKIPAEHVIHFKTFNPNNPFVGMGAIEAAAFEIDSNLAASVWNQVFFENSARPDTVLIMDPDTTLDPDSIAKIKSDWNTKHQGTNRAHKMSIIHGAVKDIKSIQPTQKDMDFVNLKQMTRDDILAIFRVPKTIVAITDDVNRANAEASAMIFAERTIKPLLRRYVETLNVYYLPRFAGKSENLFFDFVDPTPENRELILDEDTRLLEKGAITINEVRQKRGLDKIEGGDTPLIPMGLTPLGITPKIDPLKDKIKKTLKGSDLTFEIRGAMLQKRMVKRVVKWEKLVDSVSKDNFDDMEAEMLSNLKSATKSVDGKKLLNVAKATSLWFRSLRPIVNDIYDDEGASALTFLGTGLVFDVTTAPIQREITEGLKRMSKSVVRETVMLIEKDLNAGLAAGEGIDGLRKRLMNSFKGMKRYRAERIARSEVITAANKATVEAWVQSGVVEKKIWYTALDERVCPTCNAMHGQTASLKTLFIKKGGSMIGTDNKKYTYDYRDIGEPALHPNCRCTLVPKLFGKTVTATTKIERKIKKEIVPDNTSFLELKRKVNEAIEGELTGEEVDNG